MQIRSITSADTLPLRQLVLWPDHPISASQVEGDPGALHFGGFMADRLITVASLFSDGDAVRLRKFATHPDFQGQGAGSAMLRHLVEISQTQGRKRFWLDARETALPFYRRHGFTVQGDRFFKRDLPYFRMEMTL
ncbi:GNAT family N-acetyltransferase [Epibacterium ulvae]|uniref:GNAT family N-acetyltransferase n=1 Tax=Epibacterium ulvae TaxID=1156985 RepID=UPI001BFC2505|nr:GNAT family N-acetyltransferase [Epibacterium ulvae]MBT8155732.1 GNAT family N-acetyltransferase [Epibacterium ulvae]